MTDSLQTELPEAAAPAPGLKKRWVALLWLALTAAVIPFILFIRGAALEVSQYQVSTFEGYARKAIEERNYARALELCTGAYKSGVNRSDHWGKIYALRTQAYLGLGELDKALGELEAGAQFWTRRYYYATDPERAEAAHTGSELANKLLAADRAPEALRAFSAAGIASGRPVEFLYDLNAKLDPAQKTKLWPAEPYLVVQRPAIGKDDLLETVIEEQGRTVKALNVDTTVTQAGVPSSSIALSESGKPGRSCYGVSAYLPLTDKPFALRVFVKEEQTADTAIMLGYWFDSARKSAATFDRASSLSPEGWKIFDIRRNFYAERLAEANEKSYLIAGGFINKIALDVPQGAANRFWVGRIELYLPPGA
jgi:hypothetical protein